MISYFQRGSCYTFNSGKEGHPLLNVSGAGGRQQGLELILNPELDDYYGIFSYESPGFKVLVHDQRDAPLMDQYGTTLSPGFTLTLSVTKYSVSI